jgi:hypothetical protein
MKKVLFLTAIFSFSISIAQITTDSVSMGGGTVSYPYDVFYNITSGTKDTIRNTNWHLAFAVRSAQPPLNVTRAAAVRANGARGVEVYAVPAGTNWADIDSNFKNYKRLIDSDTTWDIGGFNDGFSVQTLNFGWGNYNMDSRHIDGNKNFLIRIVTTSGFGPGATTVSVFKKFRIIQLSFDTTWYAAFANIDGSDSTTLEINKADYQGKLFAYYNLLTKQPIDREPSTPWHLLWTRYFARVRAFGIDTTYSVTGILQHPNVQSGRVSGVYTDSAEYQNAMGKFSSSINTIGWDWKISPQGPPSSTPWELVDSLSFFIKTAGMTDSAYKMVFTKFTGPNPQITVFNKQIMLNPLASIASRVAGNLSMNVYPNPASSVLYIDLPQLQTNQATITITDITGKTVYQNVVTDSKTGIDVSAFNKGIYFVQVRTVNAIAASRIMIK